MSAREINMLSSKVSQLAERIDGMVIPAAVPVAAPAAPAAPAFDEEAFLRKVSDIIDEKIAASASSFNETVLMQKVCDIVDQKIGVAVPAAVAAAAPATTQFDNRRPRKADSPAA